MGGPLVPREDESPQSSSMYDVAERLQKEVALVRRENAELKKQLNGCQEAGKDIAVTVAKGMQTYIDKLFTAEEVKALMIETEVGSVLSGNNTLNWPLPINGPLYATEELIERLNKELGGSDE